MITSTTCLDVRGLYFDYPDKAVLNNIHFSLFPGEILHLRGKNGAGKTSLLKIIAGLVFPQRGEIHYQGQSILNDIAFYHKNLCYLGHQNGVSRSLSIQEYYAFECLEHAEQGPTLNEVLAHLSLVGLAHHCCARLSAGQARRVALMRLFLSPAKLWLLDEPLVALDEAGLNALSLQLKAHRARGGCVILTSHQVLPTQMGDYREYDL